MPLPKYHPGNFQPSYDPMLGGYPGQGLAPGVQRATQPVEAESPRLMRDRQRELIERARMSSKIAASPGSIKPGAPRLNPTGSPKGAVTPLTLEETQDYFQLPREARSSPLTSPGGRSDRSSKDRDDARNKKSAKLELPR